MIKFLEPNLLRQLCAFDRSIAVLNNNILTAISPSAMTRTRSEFITVRRFLVIVSTVEYLNHLLTIP